MSTSDDTPEALNQRAEELLAEEKWDEGMALLARALDVAPTFAPALESLGIIAVLVPARFVDALFTRLEAAESQARDDEERAQFRWYRLCYLAWHGDLDALRKLAPLSAFDDEDRAACLASLWVDLGVAGAEEDLARALVGLAGRRGRGELMSLLSVAATAIRTKAPDAERLLDEAARRVEMQDDPGLYLMSFLIVLKVHCAVNAGRVREAFAAARDLYLPPDRHSPAAMLAARRLLAQLGPLPG